MLQYEGRWHLSTACSRMLTADEVHLPWQRHFKHTAVGDAADGIYFLTHRR